MFLFSPVYFSPDSDISKRLIYKICMFVCIYARSIVTLKYFETTRFGQLCFLKIFINTLILYCVQDNEQINRAYSTHWNRRILYWTLHFWTFYRQLKHSQLKKKMWRRYTIYMSFTALLHTIFIDVGFQVDKMNITPDYLKFYLTPNSQPVKIV